MSLKEFRVNSKEKWNKIYASREEPGEPALVLNDNHELLPGSGHALDIACGLGANSIFLAGMGLHVDAWDISDVVIEKLRNKNADGTIHPTIQARVVDISPGSLRPEAYDVIINTHYLDRTLAPAMIDALKPGGVIFFQTFSSEKTIDTGPSNPDYLLQKNELKILFGELEVLAYQDQGTSTDPDNPLAGQAYIVARKPGNLGNL